MHEQPLQMEISQERKHPEVNSRGYAMGLMKLFTAMM